MKIKKLLAILSSVMVISACAVSPIYAEETTAGPTENQQQEGKITDLNEISNLISDFIKEKELAALVCIDDAIMADVVTVTVLHHWEEKETIEPIKAFINENCIDESLVNFMIFEGSIPVDAVPTPDTSITIRDAAAIASALAKKGAKDLIYDYPDADYNKDGVVNIRDAAAIAKDLAKRN